MRRRGFTLIELLVVIAIIALLMAVLMPALTRVRKQAKAVVCQTRLKQWGLYFSMYCDDNDGFFQAGQAGIKNVNFTLTIWPHALRRYHKHNYKFFLCPMASKPLMAEEDQSDTGARNPYAAWGVFASQPGHWSYGEGRANDRGSYGNNGWTCNPNADADIYGYTSWSVVFTPDKFWRTPNVKGGSTIPLFFDSIWSNTWPNNARPAPPAMPSLPVSADFFTYLCLDRHDGFINMLFMDYSVRKVGLKELWTLKWYRGFDTGYVPDWTTEAPWMRNFKDYATDARGGRSR